MEKPAPHFKGKTALGHLIEARQKGRKLMGEPHGRELPGTLFAFIDAAKEGAVLIGSLTILLSFLTSSLLPIAIFGMIYALIKCGRAGLLEWRHLQRLHQLIEEERWEIEHHREQERSELIALYKAKGFSGKLLDEAISVLMADDNRLLQVMLEEELGLTLESVDHPVKQALGAFLGALLVQPLLLIPYASIPLVSTILITGGLSLLILSFIEAKLQKVKEVIPLLVEPLAIAYLCYLSTYFIARLVL